MLSPILDTLTIVLVIFLKCLRACTALLKVHNRVARGRQSPVVRGGLTPDTFMELIKLGLFSLVYGSPHT